MVSQRMQQDSTQRQGNLYVCLRRKFKGKNGKLSWQKRSVQIFAK